MGMEAPILWNGSLLCPQWNVLILWLEFQSCDGELPNPGVGWLHSHQWDPPFPTLEHTHLGFGFPFSWWLTSHVHIGHLLTWEWKSPFLREVSPTLTNGSSPTPEWDIPLPTMGASHVTIGSFQFPLVVLPFLAMEASIHSNGASPTVEWKLPLSQMGFHCTNWILPILASGLSIPGNGNFAIC